MIFKLTNSGKFLSFSNVEKELFPSYNSKNLNLEYIFPEEKYFYIYIIQKDIKYYLSLINESLIFSKFDEEIILKFHLHKKYYLITDNKLAITQLDDTVSLKKYKTEYKENQKIELIDSPKTFSPLYENKYLDDFKFMSPKDEFKIKSLLSSRENSIKKMTSKEEKYYYKEEKQEISLIEVFFNIRIKIFNDFLNLINYSDVIDLYNITESNEFSKEDIAKINIFMNLMVSNVFYEIKSLSNSFDYYAVQEQYDEIFDKYKYEISLISNKYNKKYQIKDKSFFIYITLYADDKIEKFVENKLQDFFYEDSLDFCKYMKFIIQIERTLINIILNDNSVDVENQKIEEKIKSLKKQIPKNYTLEKIERKILENEKLENEILTLNGFISEFKEQKLNLKGKKNHDLIIILTNKIEDFQKKIIEKKENISLNNEKTKYYQIYQEINHLENSISNNLENPKTDFLDKTMKSLNMVEINLNQLINLT